MRHYGGNKLVAIHYVRACGGGLRFSNNNQIFLH